MKRYQILNTKMSVLNFLEGKNVLVFDTETTGLPERKNNKFGEYYPYYMSHKYDSSRMVSIAWKYIPNFSKTTMNSDDIQHFIRYPEDFYDIPNSHIHGITYEHAQQTGIPFNDILEAGLYEAIKNCHYIIAHNVLFDYHILASELFRVDNENLMATECVIKLNELINNKGLVCTGELGKDLCQLEFTNNYYNYNNSYGSPNAKRVKKYKMPKLVELYKHFYNTEFPNQHNASGDVWALLEVMKLM